MLINIIYLFITKILPTFVFTIRSLIEKHCRQALTQLMFLMDGNNSELDLRILLVRKNLKLNRQPFSLLAVLKTATYSKRPFIKFGRSMIKGCSMLNALR
jgi:hypothetical protein